MISGTCHDGEHAECVNGPGQTWAWCDCECHADSSTRGT